MSFLIISCEKENEIDLPNQSAVEERAPIKDPCEPELYSLVTVEDFFRDELGGGIPLLSVIRPNGELFNLKGYRGVEGKVNYFEMTKNGQSSEIIPVVR